MVFCLGQGSQGAVFTISRFEKPNFCTENYESFISFWFSYQSSLSKINNNTHYQSFYLRYQVPCSFQGQLAGFMKVWLHQGNLIIHTVNSFHADFSGFPDPNAVILLFFIGTLWVCVSSEVVNWSSTLTVCCVPSVELGHWLLPPHYQDCNKLISIFSQICSLTTPGIQPLMSLTSNKSASFNRVKAQNTINNPNTLGTKHKWG